MSNQLTYSVQYSLTKTADGKDLLTVHAVYAKTPDGHLIPLRIPSELHKPIIVESKKAAEQIIRDALKQSKEDTEVEFEIIENNTPGLSSFRGLFIPIGDDREAQIITFTTLPSVKNPYLQRIQELEAQIKSQTSATVDFGKTHGIALVKWPVPEVSAYALAVPLPWYPRSVVIKEKVTVSVQDFLLNQGVQKRIREKYNNVIHIGDQAIKMTELILHYINLKFGPQTSETIQQRVQLWSAIYTYLPQASATDIILLWMSGDLIRRDMYGLLRVEKLLKHGYIVIHSGLRVMYTNLYGERVFTLHSITNKECTYLPKTFERWLSSQNYKIRLNDTSRDRIVGALISAQMANRLSWGWSDAKLTVLPYIPHAITQPSDKIETGFVQAFITDLVLRGYE